MYSVNKKLTKAVKDEILIYQSLGYKIIQNNLRKYLQKIEKQI